MEDRQPDSLEDWVAVRSDAFTEAASSVPKRIDIHVAWNHIQNVFSITIREKIGSGFIQPQVLF